MKFSITGARMLSPLLSNPPLSGKCLIKRTRYSGKFTTLTSRVSRNIYVKNTRYITTRLLHAFVSLCNRRPLSSSPISHSQYHTYHPKILNHAMPQRNIITTIRSDNSPRYLQSDLKLRQSSPSNRIFFNISMNLCYNL